MNRYAWNLRYDSPPAILPVAFYEGNGPEGPIALPGKYTVKLTAGGESQTAPLELIMDPRVKVPETELQQQHELSMQIWNSITQLHEAVNQIRGLRQDLDAVKDRLGEQASAKPLVEQIDALEKKIAPIEEDLVQVNMKSSEGNLSFPNKLDEEFDTLRAFVENADNPPTQGQEKVYHDMNTELQQDLTRWKQIAESDVPALNEAIQKAQIPAISVHPLTE
jgi:DNA repair exonuclease SbcCD ATPase subunit